MTRNPKCSPYDLRALEAWLAELAADGLELTGSWKEFQESEKRKARFYIEPAQENAEPPQSLRDSRALLGWEYVCSMEKGSFYVWRSTGETAHPPRARELSGSWADKRLGRKLLWFWLGEFVVAALSIILLAGSLYSAENMPVWSLLTDGGAQMSILTLLLGAFCGFWATRREHRDLRRLRRAIREGEYQEAVAQHVVWYGVMRWLPAVVSLLLLLPFVRLGIGNGYRDPAEYPFIAAEDMDGAQEERDARERSTPLCDVHIVQEGGLADFRDRRNWWLCTTQLEVYRPRARVLAGPLSRDLIRHYGMAQVNPLDGIDAAYYGRDGAVQYLLLRGGGTVLFYRTNAPDGLRAHMDEFAALLRAYQ